MTTPQTLRVLASIMDENTLTQQQLADSAGLERVTVSHHLTGNRPVRDDHMASYLSAIPRDDRPRLFAAWVHDVLAEKPELLEDLFDAAGQRLQQGVIEWAPELSPAHRDALEWWAQTLRLDKGNADVFDSVTRRLRSDL